MDRMIQLILQLILHLIFQMECIFDEVCCQPVLLFFGSELQPQR